MHEPSGVSTGEVGGDPGDMSSPSARVPFTLLDLVLVVVAFGLSFGMAVRALEGLDRWKAPPIQGFFSNPAQTEFGAMLPWIFGGVMALGPILHGIHFLRFRRRHWTAVEWTWTTFGLIYVLFPLGLEGVMVLELPPELTRSWGYGVERVLVYVLFYLAPGPVALTATLARLFRRQAIPWSGWMGLFVLLTWSAVWPAALWGPL